MSVQTDRALPVRFKDEDGNAHGRNNPVPVEILEGSGTKIHDHNKATAVAVAASSNHDFTVPDGKTFYLKQWRGASESRAKFVLQIEDASTPAQFNEEDIENTSEIRSAVDVTYSTPREVKANGADRIVRIVKTNHDELFAYDINSKIMGWVVDNALDLDDDEDDQANL